VRIYGHDTDPSRVKTLFYETQCSVCRCVCVGKVSKNVLVDCKELLKFYVADKSSSHSDSMQNHRKSSGKLSSSSSKTSSALKDKDSEDTDPSRVKTLCDSPDHISAKLNQRILSADHTVGIIPSVSSLDCDISNDNTESAPLTAASQRPKTVKTIGSKMRSTGKWQASCQAFPHDVPFWCRSVLTFWFVLQQLCQLSDGTCNLYLLSLTALVHL